MMIRARPTSVPAWQTRTMGFLFLLLDLSEMMGRTKVVIVPVMVRMVPNVPTNKLSRPPLLKNCRTGSSRVVRVK